jgi:hypothetical protein
MEKLYNEAINMGRFQSKFGIGYTLIVLLLSIAVFYFVYKSFNEHYDNDYIDTPATILESDCRYYMTSYGGKYSCNITVKYNVNGVDHVGNVISDSMTMYHPNSNIIIQYYKNDPKLIMFKEKLGLKKYFLYFVIAATILSLFATLFKYYMANKYDLYSSLYGASSAIGHGLRSHI